MSKILLQTTIPQASDDWGIARFSLLAAELRAAGHRVTTRDRDERGRDDHVLSRLDELDYDQLWLMVVDVGDGLTTADAAAITRFRESGGGVLTARDHQDLGSCLVKLGSLGAVNQFHDKAVDPVHELLRSTRTASGRIECFPAHPHEGRVSSDLPFATVVTQGRSAATGRRFNLAVALDGERAADGKPMGRAVAESTFHHFADYNWDVDCGAPSFVTEVPGGQIKADPSHLVAFKDYVRNVAGWLHPVRDDTTTPGRTLHDSAAAMS